MTEARFKPGELDRLKDRIGQEFEGELHLTEDEALRLIQAARENERLREAVTKADLFWDHNNPEAGHYDLSEAIGTASDYQHGLIYQIDRAALLPSVFAFSIAIDTDGDGEADDEEVRAYPTMAEAEAALAALRPTTDGGK